MVYVQCGSGGRNDGNICEAKVECLARRAVCQSSDARAERIAFRLSSDGGSGNQQQREREEDSTQKQLHVPLDDVPSVVWWVLFFWGGAAYAELVHACAVLLGILPPAAASAREGVASPHCLWSLCMLLLLALHMDMEDQEWMCWQVDGEDIDFEAQKRELERLEQARRDRLVAEELQHDLSTDREMSSECLTDPTEIPPPSSYSEALEPPGECREEVPEPALRFKISDATPGPSSTRSFSPLDTAPSSLPTSVQTDGPLSHYTDCRFTDFDQRLAEQLQEEERLEIERRESDVKSQTERDAELARALQGEEERDRGEGEGEEMEGV